MANNSPANADVGDAGLIPGLGRSPRKRKGNPLQYSCLESSMGRGTWWATGQRVAELATTEQLSIHTHTQVKDWESGGDTLGLIDKQGASMSLIWTRVVLCK